MTNNKEQKQKNIRVLIAKPGLDGHGRGAKVVVHALKDAGMTVFYSGLHKTIEEIVIQAQQENVDVIGLSIYSGAHLSLGQELMDLLQSKKQTEMVVIIGGNIPQKDVKALKKFGVSAVFPTGANLDEITSFIKLIME